MADQTQISDTISYNQSKPPQVYKIKQYKPPTLKQSLSYMLIRPPRFLYNDQLLIPPPKYQHIYTIEQHLIPFKLTLYRVQNMRYIILYIFHGNSSSRFQGYMHLKQLPPGAGLACFDFNGCGMRFEAEFITLGKNQSKQVDIAVKFLKTLGYPVVGWGRSMGSVSLLLSQQCDYLVADSPFCSLSQLCRQSSEKIFPTICCCFLKCFYSCVFNMIRADVLQKTGMDPNELQVVKLVSQNPRNKDRTLFIMAGHDDSMIHPGHAHRIYDAFPGKKKITVFDGTHNSNRPSKVIRQCLRFIEQSLGLEPHPDLLKTKKKKPRNIRLKPMYKQQSHNIKSCTEQQTQDMLLPNKNKKTIRQNSSIEISLQELDKSQLQVKKTSDDSELKKSASAKLQKFQEEHQQEQVPPKTIECEQTISPYSQTKKKQQGYKIQSKDKLKIFAESPQSRKKTENKTIQLQTLKTEENLSKNYQNQRDQDVELSAQTSEALLGSIKPPLEKLEEVQQLDVEQ